MITRQKVKEEITRILQDPGFYDQHESEGAYFLLTLIDPYIKQVAKDTRKRCSENAKTYDDSHRGRINTYIDIDSILRTEIILP